jgi:hypothetical protein
VNVAILVPTLGRAHALLEPLLQNIRAVTPMGAYQVYLVLDPDDEPSWDAYCQLYRGGEGDLMAIEEDGTYPRKTNAGLDGSEGEPLVLPTADDVVFHQGWYEEALKHFEAGTQVVGTNDLSPVTADGALATMPILRRSYIESPGVVWGEPGKVFHDGYHHNAVDRELWELAQHRGVAVFEPESIIEHRHPSWGTREADETDRKGNQQHREADEALFLKRKAEWTGPDSGGLVLEEAMPATSGSCSIWRGSR